VSGEVHSPDTMSALLTLLFTLLLASPPAESLPATQVEELPAPSCDPETGPARTYTLEDRRETRARVRAVCEYVGASPITCAFMDAVVVRESSGRAGVRHRKGRREDGLGPMGISLRWHRAKWPGDDEDPMLCHPEVSALVALDTMHRAVRRYQADTMLEVQAVYGGSWSCWRDDQDQRHCQALPTAGTVRSICSRLEARGFSCLAPIDRADLGRYVPVQERRRVAALLIARFNARHQAS
jgi:hypothetical protein